MIGSVKTPLSFVSAIYYKPDYSIADYYSDQSFSKSTSVICVVNGEPILRKHWDRKIAANDNIAFVIVPRGSGIKSIIGVLAQVVVTIGVTLATGNLALGVAIGAAVGAVFSLILQPKAGGTTDAASPTYSLEAQGNQARLLNPIPKGYGLHNIYPDFASQPFTSYEGNDQILHQLFCLGLGQYEVEQVRIAETVLWYSSTGYSGNFDDVKIEIIPPGQLVTLFPAAVQTSVQVSAAELDSGVTLGAFVVNTAGTIVNSLSYDFVFASGLFKSDKNGKLQNRSVQIKNEYQQIDDNGAPLTPWIVAGQPTYTAATATAQRFTETYAVPKGRYQARSTRVTADAGNDTTISDKVVWAGLRGFQPSNNVYPNVTLLAVKMKATNQLSQQSSRLFNTIQTAKVQIWNGNAWSDYTPSRSIAWAAADMLRNPLYGEGRADSEIDLPTLLQLDAIWAARGDTFNAVFDTKRTFWESLGLVLAAGRAQPMLIAGVCTFMRDQPRTIAKGVFTPHNIRAGTFETEHILYTDITADDVIVEYQDELTWKTTDVQCTLTGSVSDNPARINIFGITNLAQAWREGMYQAACNLYRRVTGTLSTEMEGKLLVRGDKVKVSHDMPRWGTTGEIIDYDPTTRSLYLSEPAIWSNGPFMLSLANKRGQEFGPLYVTQGATDEIAIIDAASLAAIEANSGDIENIIVTDPNKIATRYTHGSTTKFAKYFIVSASSPQSFDTVSLELINDDPRVYAADNGQPPQPSNTNVTSNNGPVIASVSIALDPSVSGVPSKFIGTWSPGNGATDYVAQISYDNVSWETVYEGSAVTCSFYAQTANLNFRVAGIGLIRGPWEYFVKQFNANVILPDALADLSISSNSGGTIIVSDWTQSKNANQYLVEVIPEQ